MKSTRKKTPNKNHEHHINHVNHTSEHADKGGAESERPTRKGMAATDLQNTDEHYVKSEGPPCPAIDKLQLVLARDLVSDGESAALIDRFKDARYKKLTAKGTRYRNHRCRKLPSGTSIVVSWDPLLPNMKQFLTITLNPSHIQQEDLKALKGTLGRIFPADWKDGLQSLKIYRVDACIDHCRSIANLIVKQKGAVWEKKFVLNTDQGGQLQTMYLGSMESQEHSIVYDQNASDEYKQAHGEHVPSVAAAASIENPKLRRPDSQEKDAELGISRTRFEVRRVYKDPKSIDELGNLRSLLSNLVVFEVDPRRFAKKEGAMLFGLYLDAVRLRGINGARKYFLETFPSKENKKKISVWETRLSEFSASWWVGDQMTLRDCLKRSSAWPVLKYMC